MPGTEQILVLRMFLVAAKRQTSAHFTDGNTEAQGAPTPFLHHTAKNGKGRTKPRFGWQLRPGEVIWHLGGRVLGGSLRAPPPFLSIHVGQEHDCKRQPAFIPGVA